MSVKRYEYRHGELSDDHYNHPPAGEFVRWEDYARLKAEVERLRKAGDALVGEGETMAHEVSWVPYTWDNLVCDWNAAKEGKQS